MRISGGARLQRARGRPAKATLRNSRGVEGSDRGLLPEKHVRDVTSYDIIVSNYIIL